MTDFENRLVSGQYILPLSYLGEVWPAVKPGLTHHFLLKMPVTIQEYGNIPSIVLFISRSCQCYQLYTFGHFPWSSVLCYYSIFKADLHEYLNVRYTLLHHVGTI